MYLKVSDENCPLNDNTSVHQIRLVLSTKSPTETMLGTEALII